MNYYYKVIITSFLDLLVNNARFLAYYLQGCQLCLTFDIKFLINKLCAYLGRYYNITIWREFLSRGL